METYSVESMPADVSNRLNKLMSNEVLDEFNKLPDHRKIAVLKMPEDKLYKWTEAQANLISIKKSCDQLRMALDSKKIKDEALLITGNATYMESMKLKNMHEANLASLYNDEDPGAPTPSTPSNPHYDRGARDGSVSTRPTYKETPPTTG